MTLLVQKFGGTSVGSVEKIQYVADKIKKIHDKGCKIIVVVSAMTGETNRLLALANKIDTMSSRAREMDALLSTGEQVTAALLAMALTKKGCNAKSLTATQAGIYTDANHTRANINEIKVNKFLYLLEQNYIVVITGFQGVTETGCITTLGRGGSDTTAVAVAASVKADECQIYTDVDGVYTTDPRIVEGAKKLNCITIEEMLEMSSQGSKVLQIRSVEVANKYKVKLRVLNTFKEGTGTLITYENTLETAFSAISGIAFNRNEARITIKDIPDTPGPISEVLTTLADADIELDIIVQSSAKQGVTDLTFTVNRQDYNQALFLVKSLADKLDINLIEGDNKVAKISIVGRGMHFRTGVAATMFKALAKENIFIQAITTSEIKVSVLIEEKYIELAVRSLHSVFQLDEQMN